MNPITVKGRQSNVELYRIIVMLLIVAHHYLVNSKLQGVVNAGLCSTPRTIFYLLLCAWGKTGINCFVCITSWFMCKSNINAKKFIKLLCQIYFYRLLFSAVFICTGSIELTPRRLFSILFPLGGHVDTGFINCFIVFYLCIPFLNRLLGSISQLMHFRLVMIFLGIYTFATAIPYFSIQFNYISWFIVLYVTVAYLRFYKSSFTESRKYCGFSMLVLICIAVFSIIAIFLLTCYVNKKYIDLVYYWISDSHKILACGIGITSFLFFKNLNIPSSKIINAISATTFGVLLIHADSRAMKHFIWDGLIRASEFVDSKWFVVHSIGSVLAVFAVCSLIEFLRIKLIEPHILSIVLRSYDKTLGRFKLFNEDAD